MNTTTSFVPRAQATLHPLPAALDHMHWAYSTRRVQCSDAAGLITDGRAPQAGDLVLARVQTLGQHNKVELWGGRKARLYAGDLVVLAYGNRYAPDQFEALVPADLGPCHLVAGGGLAGMEVQRNAAMQEPTAIEPLGLLCDAQGEILNLRRYSLPCIANPARQHGLQVIVVCGTSMNSGKTYTAHELVRGFRALGHRVGAAKVTGTGAGNDPWRMRDCGARPMLDFTDAGYPSTYRVPAPEIEAITEQILRHLAAAPIDTAIIEIADGIGHFETAALLESATLRRWCSAVLFASVDPLAAVAGVQWLRERALPVCAVSGLMTAQPLILAQARKMLDLPVLNAAQLAEGIAVQEALDAMSMHHTAQAA